MSGRNVTESARGAPHQAASRHDPAGPRLAEFSAPLPNDLPAPRRRDPFAHGALPQRPNYLPEEAETAGSRSEIWASLKGLILAAVAILFLGWLLTAG